MVLRPQALRACLASTAIPTLLTVTVSHIDAVSDKVFFTAY